MGRRLGLTLQVDDDTVESKQQLDKSFAVGEHGHLTKKTKQGDIVVHSGTSGSVTITKGGGVLSTTPKGTMITPQDIKVIRVLGRGASSHVDLVEFLPEGKFMALKVMNVFEKQKRAQIVEELAALYSAKCPALVDFYGAFFSEGTVSIALEYMDMGSVDSLLKERGPFPESVVASFAFQTLWGLAYLKHEKRVHRDVKPQNILVNSRGQVKLTDFGISRELENSIGMCMTFVGTFKYMSPERIQSKPYGYASDMWSLGLVIAECATGRYPFPDCHSYIDMVQTLLDNPVADFQGVDVSAGLRECCNLCIRANPRDRIPADVLLGSPWLVQQGMTTLSAAQTHMHAWLSEGEKRARVSENPTGSPHQRPAARPMSNKFDPKSPPPRRAVDMSVEESKSPSSGSEGGMDESRFNALCLNDHSGLNRYK